MIRNPRAVLSFLALLALPVLNSTSGLANEPGEFQIKNSDVGSTLNFVGFFQSDERSYVDSGSQDQKDLFLIRRARPYFYGDLLHDFDYRLMADFGNNAVLLDDAFINFHGLGSWLQFRAGKFKQPFSYEEFVMEDRNLVEFERSMLDQLTPAREAGFMVFGEGVLGGHLDYYLSVSNGIANSDTEEPRPEKDLNARVAVHPLPGLMVGMSATYGAQQGAAAPLTLTTPLKVQWIQFNSNTVYNGDRSRLDPELAYAFGPFGFAAQYIQENQDLMRLDQGAAKSATTVTFAGYYLLATWLMTGETRPDYSTRIHPSHPFSTEHFLESPGAFELILGLSGMNASNTGTLVDQTKNALIATAGTLGVNWYLNDAVWFQLSYEHAWFNAPVLLSGGDSLQASDSIGTRFAVLF